MGLAGSAPRGTTPAADDQLARELLDSAKDRHEHALVVEALQERLAPITQTLHVPDAPVVMRLNNIQHLYTPVQGRLQAPEGVLPIVEILHPTPALGGWPRDLALEFIQTYEETPRGWYAAPVGWIDHNLDGVFAVAIRSAVVQRSRAWLYAGAGIVSDSRPAPEWEETGWKFRPILDALGVAEEARGENRTYG
jgi:menaquinone-specific isochorismate synthase